MRVLLVEDEPDNGCVYWIVRDGLLPIGGLQLPIGGLQLTGLPLTKVKSLWQTLQDGSGNRSHEPHTSSQRIGKGSSFTVITG